MRGRPTCPTYRVCMTVITAHLFYLNVYSWNGFIRRRNIYCYANNNKNMYIHVIVQIKSKHQLSLHDVNYLAWLSVEISAPSESRHFSPTFDCLSILQIPKAARINGGINLEYLCLFVSTEHDWTRSITRYKANGANNTERTMLLLCARRSYLIDGLGWSVA